MQSKNGNGIYGEQVTDQNSNKTHKMGEIMYKNSAIDPTKAVKTLGTLDLRRSVLGALGNENRGSTRQNIKSPGSLLEH